MDQERLQLLRTQTHACHERLERRVDIDRRLATRAGYVGLIQEFRGFYQPVEAMLADRFGPWLDASFDWAHRLKAPLLDRDLAALGATAAVPPCQDLPPLATREQALGCLYVFEGATLGGRVITRLLSERLGIGPTTGGAFFDSYGAATGAMWRTFRECLTTEAGEGVAWQAVIDGATATFTAFDRWLASRQAALSGAAG